MADILGAPGQSVKQPDTVVPIYDNGYTHEMKKRNLMTSVLAEKELRKLPAVAKAKLRHPRELKISADSVGDEILVTYTYSCKEDSIHYIQELGGSEEELGLSEGQGLPFLLESSRKTFVEFIEDGELNRLSLEWGTLEMEGRSIRARGCLTRPALDRLADALLAEEPL